MQFVARSLVARCPLPVACVPRGPLPCLSYALCLCPGNASAGSDSFKDAAGAQKAWLPAHLPALLPAAFCLLP